MAISFDNVSTVTTGSGTGHNITLNVAAGSDRVIIISTANEGTFQSITSIDIAETSASVGVKVDSETIGAAATQQTVEMWRIMESDLATGTNTITVNWDGSVSGAGISAMSYSGVKQQTEEAKEKISQATVTTLSQDITTLTDNALIISIMGSGSDDASYTFGTDQVERWAYLISSATFNGTTEIKASAGLDSQSFTASSSSFRIAMISAAFAEVSVGADPTITGIQNILGVQSITI